MDLPPVPLPSARAREVRAAVRAFARQPGPARFQRVVRLLEAPGAPARRRRPRLP